MEQLQGGSSIGQQQRPAAGHPSESVLVADPMMTRHTPLVVLVILFITVAYFPTFLNLDALPLRLWDESRTAVSAYEMYSTGNLLVPHYAGEPDMWGVKPPLVLWWQTLFFHLLGPGELAARLPAAISAFLIGWLFFHFSWKRLQRPWLGLLTCAVLYSSHGFLHMHGARSADHDVPATLFMCASLLMIYRWSITGDGRHMLWFFILLGLGALTKSVQALLFMPGIFLWLVITRRLGQLLRERMSWTGILVFIVMVMAYYLGRESVNPGYLQAVWDNELWGRYATTLESHEHPWDMYARLIILQDLPHWYLLVPAGLALGLMHEERRVKEATALVGLAVTVYLLVISTSSTKVGWYTVPAIPLLSFLAGMALYVAGCWIMRTFAASRVLASTSFLPYILFFLLFAEPWFRNTERHYLQEEYPWDRGSYALSKRLKDAVHGVEPLDADVLVREDIDQHYVFYLNLLKDQGHPLERRRKEDLLPGQRAAGNEPWVRDQIMEHYDHEILADAEGFWIIGVKGPRGHGIQ